jgi:hypothetical protein
MPARPVSTQRFPLVAAGLQLLAWLAIVGLYTRIYSGQDTRLSILELPLTYGLLAISGVGGGGLALLGIYRLLWAVVTLGRHLYLCTADISAGNLAAGNFPQQSINRVSAQPTPFAPPARIGCLLLSAGYWVAMPPPSRAGRAVARIRLRRRLSIGLT